MTTAPTISPDYPRPGSPVGPAWQELWDYLEARRGEWVDGPVLYWQQSHIAAKTARKLLREAVVHGVVEQRVTGSYRRAEYRLPMEGGER